MTQTIPTGLLLSMFLMYPGLLTALILGTGYGILRDGISQTLARLRSIIRPVIWTSSEGILLFLSIILVASGLPFIPLPLHPAPPGPAGWFLAWAFLEGAWVLPLIPSLLAGSPMIVRAASREIQIGVSGRTLLWMILAIGLILHHHQNTIGMISAGVAHLIITIATLITLPVAIGWGPFASQTSLVPGGSWQGFPRDLFAVGQFSYVIRTAVLVFVSLGIVLPLPHTGAGLLLLLGAFIGYTILLCRLDGRWPGYTLSDALHIILWRIFPLSIVSFMFIMLTLAT